MSRTDRRTDDYYDDITAVCVASRGKTHCRNFCQAASRKLCETSSYRTTNAHLT